MTEVSPDQLIERQARKVIVAGEMPDEMLDAVRVAAMDPRHNGLDELVKNWIPAHD